MIYTSKATEPSGVLQVAGLMSAAARTAPKACGIDLTDTLVLDGEDKDRLTAAMREIAKEQLRATFERDAGCVDASHCIVLIGGDVKPRGLNCGWCGAETCAAAQKDGIACALSVNDVGIALGSAAATAMDHRIDNRILYTAGLAAIRLKLFPDDIKICFGIGLATAGKNIFFDRPLSAPR